MHLHISGAALVYITAHAVSGLSCIEDVNSLVQCTTCKVKLLLTSRHCKHTLSQLSKGCDSDSISFACGPGLDLDEAIKILKRWIFEITSCVYDCLKGITVLYEIYILDVGKVYC
ncbi:hypothetical protein BDV23DRAFT_160300 [Aspergillus alliaceus]|uniref:Uncharacterized protein n=1 Tax=Petromyces alliaceus TaxID=209559 RepID=A0A5N7C162_PETAA|nr:hypothetical protein BDV23DRAFT_160300 [Aspergillus alliaceus]